MCECTTERWLPILGLEGSYECSSCGRIRSLDRVITRPTRWGSLATAHISGKILKPSIDLKGYLCVSLRTGGDRVVRPIHQLVLETFVCPRPAGMECCHGPAGRLDNHPANLRWDTHKNNMLDKRRDRTHHLTNRTHCPRGHPLFLPNLVPRILPQRSCLACSRAHAAVNAARKRGTTVPDFQSIADTYYTQIINGDAARPMGQRNKTCCPRGHPLVAPNLRVADTRKGRRVCLACDRASAVLRNSKHPDMQKLSDQYYGRIVAN